MTLDEAYADYQSTLHTLECARLAHDEAYKDSQAKYKIWLNLGGDHETEPGYRHRDT